MKSETSALTTVDRIIAPIGQCQCKSVRAERSSRSERSRWQEPSASEAMDGRERPKRPKWSATPFDFGLWPTLRANGLLLQRRRQARRTQEAPRAPSRSRGYLRWSVVASRTGRNSESADQFGHCFEFARSLPTLYRIGRSCAMPVNAQSACHSSAGWW